MSAQVVNRVVGAGDLSREDVRRVVADVVIAAGFTRSASIRAATTFGRSFRPRWLVVLSVVGAPPTLGLSLLALFVRARHVCTVTVESMPRGSTRVHLTGVLDAEIVRTLEAQLARHPLRPSRPPEPEILQSDTPDPVAWASTSGPSWDDVVSSFASAPAGGAIHAVPAQEAPVSSRSVPARPDPTPDATTTRPSGGSDPSAVIEIDGPAEEKATSDDPPTIAMPVIPPVPPVPALASVGSGVPALPKLAPPPGASIRPRLERPTAPPPSSARRNAPSWEEALGLPVPTEAGAPSEAAPPEPVPAEAGAPAEAEPVVVATSPPAATDLAPSDVSEDVPELVESIERAPEPAEPVEDVPELAVSAEEALEPVDAAEDAPDSVEAETAGAEETTDAPAPTSEEAVGGETAPPAEVGEDLATVLVFDNGDRVVVTGAGVMGRNPKESGKKPAQVVRVADPERSLSATHLAFALDGDEFVVVDRRSTNGTWIVAAEGARERCAPGARTAVPAGSRVAIGARWFDVTRAPAGSVTAVP